MSQSPDSVFKSVEENREAGSYELLKKCLNDIEDRIRSRDSLERSVFDTICRRLVEVRAEMITFRNTGFYLFQRTLNRLDDNSLIDAFLLALDSIRTEHDESHRRIVSEWNSNFDDETIVVYSRSGTILNVLQSKSLPDQVIVLESRPGGEGIEVCKKIIENQDLVFGYDMEAHKYLDMADALYLGADAFDSNGRILNKVGTQLLCRISAEFSVRVFSSIMKYTPSISDTGPTIGSPDSLPRPLHRQHPLFEIVEADVIDTYVTDRGCFQKVDELIGEVSDIEQAQREWEEYYESDIV